MNDRAELTPVLEAMFRQRTVSQWNDLCARAGVPCGPIYTIGQVFEDPQVRARNMKIDLAHPLAGRLATVASPIRLSATPLQYDRSPPVLGQHNEEVLGSTELPGRLPAG